jgi:hypothetical protein
MAIAGINDTPTISGVSAADMAALKDPSASANVPPEDKAAILGAEQPAAAPAADPAQVQQAAQSVQDYRKGMEGQINAVRAANPMPKPPTEDELRIHPQQAQAFLPMMMALSALGGMATRTPLIGAIQNMNAVMKAQITGDKEFTDHHEKEMWAQYDAAMKAHADAQSALKPMVQEYLKGSPQSVNDLRMELFRQGYPQSVVDEVLSDPNKFLQHQQAQNALVEKSKEHADAIKAKSDAQKGGRLSPEATSAMAKQYLEGDKSVMQNIGRGAQGAENIVALREEITRQMEADGKTPHDVAMKIAEFTGMQAGERTLGTKLANITVAATEAKKTIPIALKASQAFKRSNFPSLNKAIAQVAAGTGDTDIVKFVAATNAVINTYARAISPSGVPTVADKEHARDVLNTAQSPEQYAAVMDILQQEINAALESPPEVRAAMAGEHAGGGGKSFATEAEAAAANLAPDTRVTIGGKTGTWQ